MAPLTKQELDSYLLERYWTSVKEYEKTTDNKSLAFDVVLLADILFSYGYAPVFGIHDGELSILVTLASGLEITINCTKSGVVILKRGEEDSGSLSTLEECHTFIATAES